MRYKSVLILWNDLSRVNEEGSLSYCRFKGDVIFLLIL